MWLQRCNLRTLSALKFSRQRPRQLSDAGTGGTGKDCPMGKNLPSAGSARSGFIGFDLMPQIAILPQFIA
jgi:hypothetical protein